MVLVGEVDNLLDARLNNRFGTLVTGEQTYVYGRAGELLAACIENCVKLGVYDVLIFGFALAFISVPGELVVGAALWEAVVAGGEYALICINNAGAYLS